MRASSTSLLTALACFLLLSSSPLFAAPQADAVKSKLENNEATKVAIAPHRAIYTMALNSAKNGSNITGVAGRMLFEWADVCDGWAVQQHLHLHFTYAEGDESDVTSTVISWESKDGKRYNFNVRRVSDGKETDRYEGRAELGPSGGKVIYTLPKAKTVTLDAGTMFPTAHTELLISKALASEKLFSRRVFDGSDEDGISDISAFIGPELGKMEIADLDPKLKDTAVLGQLAWPVRMAFFKTTTETGEPDYEMNLSLLANGVARSMLLDYGDFSVSGKLSDIEALKTPTCNE